MNNRPALDAEFDAMTSATSEHASLRAEREHADEPQRFLRLLGVPAL